MKFILASALSIVILGCNSGKLENERLLGTRLPSIKILMADDSTFIKTDSNTLEGPTVVFFFGPNCPFCKGQLTNILKMIDKVKNVKFYILTIWPYTEMKAFYETYHLQKYDNIITGIDSDKLMINFFGAYEVPYTAIYGKDNRLKGSFSGEMTANKILETIKD